MILKRFNLKSIQGIGQVISELALLKFPVWIYIGDDRANRSNNQLRYLWGVVYKVISMEIGYTINEVHELCKLQFGIKKLYKNIKGGQYDPDTSINVTAPLSTTEYDTKEMTDYIEAIRIFYGENGIHIPDPNEIPDELMIEMNKR
jgi:hypothetical protein